MELRIQSVNFDAAEQLNAFVEKKVSKLKRFSDNIVRAEVILKVVKPETANNKEASIKMNLKQGEVFASKTADTFEEAIDLCTAAIEKKIVKTKEKENSAKANLKKKEAFVSKIADTFEEAIDE